MTCTIIGIIVSCLNLATADRLSPADALATLQKVSTPYVAVRAPEPPDVQMFITRSSTQFERSTLDLMNDAAARDIDRLLNHSVYGDNWYANLVRISTINQHHHQQRNDTTRSRPTASHRRQ